MFNQLSLKTKAIILSAAFGIIPVLGSGAIAYYFANKNILNSKIAEEEAVAINFSDKINRFLYDRYSNIQAIANLPAFNNLKVSAAMTTQEKNKLIDKYIELYPIYDSIAVFDLKGDVIAQSSGKPLANHYDRAYFQQVLKTKEPYMSNVTISKSSGIIATYFVSPVKDTSTGQMIGIARTRMPIENLDILGESADATGQEWYLIDNGSGKFIGSSVKEEIGKEVADEFELFAEMSKTEVGSRIDVRQLDQKEELIAYAPFEKLEGLPQIPWGVITAQETKKAFVAQKQLGMVIIWGTIFTAVLTTSIAYLLANQITAFIQNIANAIANSSLNIASTVEKQELTVSEQATSVNQLTATINELGSSSRQSAQQATSSAAGASEALALAEEGAETVNKTMEGMGNLMKKVQAIAGEIIELSEQTSQISQISELVADLADQTNILALNAGVEAARAGENGKGFEVVAREIRQLADESKKSADQINDLVHDIQASMNSTVMVTDEGTKTAEVSIKLAKGTAKSFIGVKEAINSVVLNSQQISLSAKQQAVGIQQILGAVEAINLGAKETATGITQVKSNTEKLSTKAQQLQKSVT
ncbi:MAG: methyl-accepting chemotaxis protein [Xenococcaceae cyanobacterium MO_188.B19]|nr:methyl-accepting chemotaxis protein [Xenococcaceae cyanobacterium MO_188.B19]